MCLAIPGEVIDINGNLAKVNVMGVTTDVNIQLIEEVKVGDLILIHAGCAIEKINPIYYEELYSMYKEMLDEYPNES